MVPTLDQPGRQTWRDTRIPRPRRTLVSTSPYPPSYPNLSPSQSIGDGQKGSAFILEYLKDPQTASSDEPTDTPFHRVFDIDVPLWEWYELPEQSYRRRRFGVAMHGIGLMQPPEVLTNGEFLSIDEKEVEFLRFIKLWSGDRFRRDRKSLMSVVGSVLRPCASLALFRMSNVSFKISLKFVDKPRVYVIPPFFYLYTTSISDTLIVAVDERSPGSGGRRSSRFPTSWLFHSSAYQRRLCFHPQAGSYPTPTPFSNHPP